MNTTTTSLIALGALTLAACGGGSDDAASTETTAAETTVAPTTAAPETTAAPATTAAPETTVAPETTAAPETTEPDAGLGLGPFCQASEEFYVTSEAVFTYANTNGAASVLIPAAIAEAQTAIDAAPAPELAAQPTEARDALLALDAALAPVGYDPDELTDAGSLVEPFETIEQIGEQLAAFLTNECATDITALDAEAVTLADGLDASNPDDDSSGGDDAGGGETPSGETAAVTDDTGQISATIPAAWSEVRGAPDGEFRQLIASADVDAYLASYTLSGMYLLSGDAPDADAAWRAAQGGALDNAENAGGCTVQISTPYSDGVYEGQEQILNCGGDSTLHAIGGANGDNDVWFLLLLVDDADGAQRQIVVDTFLVG